MISALYGTIFKLQAIKVRRTRKRTPKRTTRKRVFSGIYRAVFLCDAAKKRNFGVSDAVSTAGCASSNVKSWHFSDDCDLTDTKKIIHIVFFVWRL